MDYIVNGYLTYSMFVLPLRFFQTHSSASQGDWTRSRLAGHQHGKVLDRATEWDLQVRDQYTDDIQEESHVGHDQLTAGAWQHDAAGAAQEHWVPVPQDQAEQVSNDEESRVDLPHEDLTHPHVLFLSSLLHS